MFSGVWMVVFSGCWAGVVLILSGDWGLMFRIEASLLAAGEEGRVADAATGLVAILS